VDCTSVWVAVLVVWAVAGRRNRKCPVMRVSPMRLACLGRTFPIQPTHKATTATPQSLGHREPSLRLLGLA